MSDTPTDPPDVQAARGRIERKRVWLAEVRSVWPSAHEATAELLADAGVALAHLDTLTARLAVVEGERDAAAATERAAIVAWLRSDTAQEPGMHRPALDNAALRIESNAHHEAP